MQNRLHESVATSTTHYHLAQHRTLREARLQLCLIRVHPSRSCPDRRDWDPLLVQVTRAPRVPGTRVCEPGEAAVLHHRLLVDGPSRGASVPQERRVGSKSGTPMRGWLGSRCQGVSERSWLGSRSTASAGPRRRPRPLRRGAPGMRLLAYVRRAAAGSSCSWAGATIPARPPGAACAGRRETGRAWGTRR